MSTLHDEQALQHVNRTEIAAIKDELMWQGKVLGGGALVLWALELVDTFILGQALNAWGIAPGEITGLVGVITAPFLHGNLIHLAANTAPLLLFSWLIMLRDNREWGAVTAASMLSAGLGTWLVGAAGTTHIGASGLIFGYFGFLLTIGLFQRKFSSILMSLIIGLCYGGLVFGVFPFAVPGNVSWEGHLFGLLGGVFSAWWVNRHTEGGRHRLLETGI